MRVDDLREIQGLVFEREGLLRFINSEFTARRVGIYVPSPFEGEVGRRSESHNIHLEDKTTVDAIMALALPAARKRVADIEAELTKAGIEFS